MLAKWLPPDRAREPESTVDPGPIEPIDYPSLLRRCMRKPELAALLVRKLVQQAEKDLLALASAINQNDAAGLAASAHRLKGAAANVSAEALRQAAAELETLGRNGSTAGASAWLARSQQELARLKAWQQP